ncbi:IS66-like element accessory protein TnpA [Marinobacter sp.]|uniref:IS66-like element accessory protein TnpA n=1 Tax=Marinobacter sp. TaxID=50741 RepID=UPI003B522C78
MNNVSVARPYRKRRQYTPEFKAQLVAESQIPGTSVSRIALDNDLNANQLRRWIRESKQAGANLSPAFVPINLPTAAISAEKKSNTIRIEIPRAGGPVVVEWPVDQAHQCVALLRSLL